MIGGDCVEISCVSHSCDVLSAERSMKRARASERRPSSPYYHILPPSPSSLFIRPRSSSPLLWFRAGTLTFGAFSFASAFPRCGETSPADATIAGNRCHHVAVIKECPKNVDVAKECDRSGKSVARLHSACYVSTKKIAKISIL